ncbi:MAG: hypothetical protein HRU18_03650 [Pseudoalteromonas sp.]|uniref:hypothetical protein n=1 Tax=Pseudoalteromonas sp. TaxID=53249 RepID=UPI001D25DEB4|nr:hypothetical protein [Pseudoalteromonas sp.]NRA77281.1 hypothetical protein [Pseudoalteromonas sp.]
MKKVIEIKKEVIDTPNKEIFQNVLENFLYGFIAATIIVFITLRSDLLVLLSYLIYYFYVGKVINRPKYVTSLGKFIIFPVPTSIGAFTGYKIAGFITEVILV